MMKLLTELFETEGKINLPDTIRIVARAADDLDIAKVVIFASSAANVLHLRRELKPERQIIVVTFPAGFTASPEGRPIYVGIPSPEDRREIAKAEIPLVQGVMPFRALGDTESTTVRTLRAALDLFGGGLQLCVQALLMACDAGHLYDGERCIVMTADTALLVRAGNAFRFLRPRSNLAVEHILCKPLHYGISRKEAPTLGREPETIIELPEITESLPEPAEGEQQQ